MKKVLGSTAFAIVASLMVVFPVQAYLVYFDLADSMTDLVLLLLTGPILAVAAGFAQKVKTG